MHDTAFRIGTLAMNIYADLSTARILEVGSQAINGSLRDNALPSTNYVGLDIEEGEGVDIVAKAGTLPVDDNSFDLVIASSVFEHDSAFWMTFLEMCRKAKDGGYIYINAPSNGTVHRFPQDNWRFYPDSGVALAKWAVSQGQNVSLVESFIAERGTDIWNDFVAVFRKGRITKKLPETFLHENVPSTNILTWKSKEILNPRDLPEDMALLDQARGQLKAVEGMHEAALVDRDALAKEANEFRSKSDALQTELDASKRSLEDLGSIRDELAKEANDVRLHRDALQTELDASKRSLEDLGSIRDKLAARQSELRQREEEIEQTRSDLAQMRAERDALGSVRHELAARVDELRQRDENLARMEAALTALHSERDELAERLARADKGNEDLIQKIENLKLTVRKLERDRLSVEAAMQKALDKAREQAAAAQTALQEHQKAITSAQSDMRLRFQEIATLTGLLRQQEHRSETTIGHLDWVRAVHEALTSQPRWWSLMPSDWRAQREKMRLNRHGLFDADDYLARYPDVAAAGLDPLYHYMTHGFYEGRLKSA